MFAVEQDWRGIISGGKCLCMISRNSERIKEIKYTEQMMNVLP